MIRKNVILVYNDEYISKFNNEDELVMHFVQKKHKLRNINRNTIFVTSNKIYFIDADNCDNSFNLVFKNKFNIEENDEIFFSNDVEKININNYHIFFDLALPQYLDSITLDDVDIEKEFSFRYISYYIGQNTKVENAKLIESLFPDNFFVTGMFAQRADTAEVSPLIHFANFGSDFRFNRVDGCEKTTNVSYVDKEGVSLSWSHNGDHCSDRYDMYLYTNGGNNKYGFRPHNYSTGWWWWKSYHYNEYMEWGDKHILDTDRNNNPFDKRIIFFAIGKTLDAAPSDDELKTMQDNTTEKYNKFKNITESLTNDDSVDLFKDFPISKYLAYYYSLRPERIETDIISNNSASSKNIDLIHHKDDNMYYVRPQQSKLNANVNDAYFNLPTDIVNKDVAMLRFKMLVHESKDINGTSKSILSNYNCGNQILFDMHIDKENKNKILVTYWDRTDGNSDIKYINWIFEYEVKYDIVIKIDKPNKTLSLFVDGNKVGSITDDRIRGNLSQNIRFFNWYSDCSNHNTSRADIEIADIISFQTILKDSKIPSFCKALKNMSLLEKLTYNDEEFTLEGVDKCIGDYNFGRMKRIGRNGINSLYGPISLNSDGSVDTQNSALVFNPTKLLKVPFSFVGKVKRNPQVSSTSRDVIGLDVPHATEKPFFYFGLRADGKQDQWFIHLGTNGTNYDSSKINVSTDYTGDINFILNIDASEAELILMDEDYKLIGKTSITDKQLLTPIETNIGIGGCLYVRDDRGMTGLFDGSFKKLSVFNKTVSVKEATCVLRGVDYDNKSNKEEQYKLDLRFDKPNLGLPENIKPIVNNVTIKDGVADFGDIPNTTNYIRIDNIKYFSEYTIYMRFYRSKTNSDLDSLLSLWSPHTDNEINFYAQGSKLRFENHIYSSIATTQDFGIKSNEWIDVVVTVYHDKFVIATKNKDYVVPISGTINYTYSENNVLTLGQEQDSKASGFDIKQCFMGKIERFMYVEGAYTFDEVISNNMLKKTVSRTKRIDFSPKPNGYITKQNGLLVYTFSSENISMPGSKEAFDLLESKMTEDRYIGNGTSYWINSSDNSSSLPSITTGNKVMFLTGYLNIPETGNYTFAVDGDDAVDFIIYDNDKEIFSLGYYGTHGRQGDNRHNKAIHLNKGDYRIKFRHMNGGGNMNRYLRWIKPGDVDFSNVPHNVFYYIDEVKNNIGDIKPYMSIYPNIIAFFPLTNNSKSIIGNYESSYTGDNRIPLFTNKGAFFRNSYLDYSKYDFSKTKTILATFTVIGDYGINNNWGTLLGSKKVNRSSDNIIAAVLYAKLSNYHDSRAHGLCDKIIRESKQYKIAIVELDNGNRNYYLDGVLVAENKPDNNSLMDLATIGSDNPFSDAFNGYIKNVVLVDKPLDSSTIKKIQG